MALGHWLKDYLGPHAAGGDNDSAYASNYFQIVELTQEDYAAAANRETKTVKFRVALSHAIQRKIGIVSASEAQGNYLVVAGSNSLYHPRIQSKDGKSLGNIAFPAIVSVEYLGSSNTDSMGINRVFAFGGRDITYSIGMDYGNLDGTDTSYTMIDGERYTVTSALLNTTQRLFESN